ncbi:MAG: ComEC/Rec2 family competence protein, partial [Candidatus Magasanikbacteria bacterium]|nr:ComEC/Rec2 family competence protein [Candidatus Magasanikbacteria bacterium]
QKIYPEPHGSFMLGLLIGAKKGLPDWLLNIFQIIGITHIIAISGYNITILAKVAEKTLGKIGRKYIFWGVLAMIFSFVIMTGAQASIVRAGIMGGLLVYAGFIGRKSNAVNILVLAGAVMVFLNPLILRNDIGFQLSFLATLGLVYFSPVFELWFKKLPDAICQLLSATLAAQVLTLPIIILSFGKLSLISPIANVIILGFIPIAMFLGFLSGGLGMIWLPLGQITGFLGYIVLDVIIKISELLSRIPYASVELNINNWIIWSIYYLVVGCWILAWHRRKKIKNEK